MPKKAWPLIVLFAINESSSNVLKDLRRGTRIVYSIVRATMHGGPMNINESCSPL